jgi:hypothetical protein
MNESRGDQLRRIDAAIANLIGANQPEQVSAIIGGGLPEALGRAGNAVFEGSGVAYGARWRRDGGRLLIDLDPAPMPLERPASP